MQALLQREPLAEHQQVSDHHPARCAQHKVLSDRSSRARPGHSRPVRRLTGLTGEPPPGAKRLRCPAPGTAIR